MSAKIYGGIQGIEPPKFNFQNFNRKEYNQKCDEFLNKLREQCKANSKHKNVGKVIRFQVADGYAQYMVLSMKPLQLIHINLDDGYQAEIAELLTPKKVTELIEREEKMAELFSKK